MTRQPARRLRRGLALLAASGLALLAGATPAAGGSADRSAESYTRISGAGSTWSSNAVQQWAANVSQFGMTVQFQANGSTQGRQLYANGTVDFAVSEIPYGVRDRGVTEPPPARGYAYMPIVAGGTSFMYNLKIGNRRVTNLRLSGDTIAKIFTGRITSWADPAIKADNPGLSLPARKVIPVVRSDGSGTSAQFTAWLAAQHASLWDAYCRANGRATPCGVTSNYPVGKGFTAQNQSVGVAGYVASATSEGAITYVEYSYAKNARFPVAKVLNAANYYTSPTPEAVAVGLLQARINNDRGSPNYLTSILDGVYRNADRRAYPLSSYSYMILPTDTSPPMTTRKGFTLADFGYYFLCEGQRQAPDLGYSPLPINLVQAGLEQVKKIPGVDVQNKDLKGCNNPTFSPDGKNKLAETAPQPPACDKKGPTQCADSSGAGGTNGGGGGNGGAAGGAAGGGAGGAAGGGAGAAGGTGAAGAGATATAGAGVIDPDTGELISADGGAVAGGDVTGLPVSLAADYAGGASRTALMALAVLLLAGVVVGPPLIARLQGRRSGGGS